MKQEYFVYSNYFQTKLSFFNIKLVFINVKVNGWGRTFMVLKSFSLQGESKTSPSDFGVIVLDLGAHENDGSTIKTLV